MSPTFYLSNTQKCTSCPTSKTTSLEHAGREASLTWRNHFYPASIPPTTACTRTIQQTTNSPYPYPEREMTTLDPPKTCGSCTFQNTVAEILQNLDLTARGGLKSVDLVSHFHPWVFCGVHPVLIDQPDVLLADVRMQSTVLQSPFGQKFCNDGLILQKALALSADTGMRIHIVPTHSVPTKKSHKSARPFCYVGQRRDGSTEILGYVS